MAYKTGFAKNYKDLLLALKGFIESTQKAYNVVPNPANTGTGYVSTERAVSAAPAETWTLTATSATNFTVSGSTSGAQAAATVGTPYDNSIVAFEIVAGGVAFVSGDIFTFSVTTGLGTEHWFITELKSGLTKGRWNANWDGLGGYEMIACGPGSSGDDEIFIGIQTFYDSPSSYYDWRLNGYTGYSVAAWGALPGAIPNDSNCYYPNVYLTNGFIEYWFIANGRRIIVVANVDGVYEACYLGFLLPYGLPNQLPYPLVVGGCAPSNLTLSDKRYSTTHLAHRCFVDPAGGSTGQGSLCLLNSNWLNFRNWTSESNAVAGNNVWPYIHSDYNYSAVNPNSKYVLLQRNIDGSFNVIPLVVVSSTPTENFFGELQNCFAIPAIGESDPPPGEPLLLSKDIITIAGKSYLVVKNVFRTVTWGFWAVLLE